MCIRSAMEQNTFYGWQEPGTAPVDMGIWGSIKQAPVAV